MKHIDSLGTPLLSIGGVLLGCGLGLLVWQRWRQERSYTLSSADQHFVRKAAQESLRAITLGHLAGQRGRQEAVRDYGQRLIKYHSRISSELTSLALRKGLVLPGYLSRKRQAEVEALARLPQSVFDERLARQMLRCHRQIVNLFQRKMVGADDAGLRELVKKTLPVFNEYLRLALALQRPKGVPVIAPVSMPC